MQRARIVLAGVSPQIEGCRWQSDTLLRIGRLDSLEIFFNDASISRRHAEVLATEEGWVVHDLGSTNGTFLNGVRVGRMDRKLRLLDVLQCGNLALNVACLEEEPRPPIATAERPVKIEVTTRRSWEQALEVAAPRPEMCRTQNRHLLTLLQGGYHLCHAASLDELLLSILEDAVTVLDAQGGSLILMDTIAGLTHFDRVVSIPESRGNAGTHFSRALARRSFTQGQSLLCRDVHGEPELHADLAGTNGAMSSIICALLRSPRQRLGVLHLDRSPLQKPFTPDELYLADTITAGVSASIESSRFGERQRDLFLQTVTALAQAIEMRDHYTGGHTQRVTAYAVMLAEELGLTPAERQLIHTGTPLHDIGKIGIDDRVLCKPGRLTDEEFEHMKSHVLKGAAILETIPDLVPLIPIIRGHHERWDGGGYPDNLARDRISVLARIVAVADAFDAMTSDRPYRPALPTERAFAELTAEAGTHFDPECVPMFLRLRPRVEELLAQETSLRQLAALVPGTVPGRQVIRAPSRTDP